MTEPANSHRLAKTDPRVVAIHVGTPRKMGGVESGNAAGREESQWESAIRKTKVQGSVRVGERNLEGDRQADRVHHGGRDKAVCVYSAEHYSAWRTELSLEDFSHGAFGENLTVRPWTEQLVCIGDTWRIGTACFQVSQPRQPCWKLARRWNLRDLAARVQQSGRTGWYLRVLQTGTIQEGDAIELVERPAPDWTLQRANYVMHYDKENTDLAAQLAAVGQLSSSWRHTLHRRLTPTAPDTDKARLYG